MLLDFFYLEVCARHVDVFILFARYVGGGTIGIYVAIAVAVASGIQLNLKLKLVEGQI